MSQVSAQCPVIAVVRGALCEATCIPPLLRTRGHVPFTEVEALGVLPGHILSGLVCEPLEELVVPAGVEVRSGGEGWR